MRNFLVPIPPINEQKRIVNWVAEIEIRIKEYQHLYENINLINDSIKEKLKKSILQYAIEGKLVKQNPDDEPASELIKRIRLEKEKLIKSGKLKKDKNESYIYRGSDNSYYEKFQNGKEICIDDEIPFKIPDSWTWCRIGDLFYNKTGLSYKKGDLEKKTPQMVRVLRGGNINNENFSFKVDDVFISSEYVKDELYLKKNYIITPAVTSIEHIGKIALIDKDYSDTVVGGFVLMLIPLFSNDILSKYLLFSMASEYHRKNCRDITKKSGQAFYNLSREKLMRLLLPIPPLKEQKRIVNKVGLLQSFL